MRLRGSGASKFELATLLTEAQKLSNKKKLLEKQRESLAVLSVIGGH